MSPRLLIRDTIWIYILLHVFMINDLNAEENWKWSSTPSKKTKTIGDRSSRIEDFNEDNTPKKTTNVKYAQDEYYGGGGGVGLNNVGPNLFNPNLNGVQPHYNGVGGGGGVNPHFVSNYGNVGYNGYNNQLHPNLPVPGGHNQYPIGNYGGSYGLNSYNNNFGVRPSPAFGIPPPQTSNVLVGPGGPTGIIGRPQFGYAQPPQPPIRGQLENHHNNNVLVGPGGPTGIIGRPRPPYLGGDVPIGGGVDNFGIYNGISSYRPQTFGIPYNNRGVGGGIGGQSPPPGVLFDDIDGGENDDRSIKIKNNNQKIDDIK